MAKIKFSAIGITNISGKSGGTVFSRNRGGFYVKNFVKPSNPQTVAQTLMRRIFASVAQRWATLSPAQKKAWGAYGNSQMRKDVFGDARPLSNRGAFISVNHNRLHGGFTDILLNPPTEKIVIPAYQIQLDDNAPGAEAIMLVNIDNLPVLPNTIFASMGLSKNSVSSEDKSLKKPIVVRKRVALVAGNQIIPINDLLDDGGIQPGDGYVVSIHYHTADGQKSAEQTFKEVRI